MHRVRSNRQIFCLRLSAICFIIMYAAIAASISVVAFGLWHADTQIVEMSLYIVVGVLVTAIIYRISAGSASCPLCRSQPMLSKRCQRNRKASQLLGSYRAIVALCILFTNKFRCPYCGEPSRCQVKPRPGEED